MFHTSIPNRLFLGICVPKHRRKHTSPSMLGMRRLFPSMSLHLPLLLLLLLLAVCCSSGVIHAAIQESTARSIQMVNKCGPFLGVVVCNTYEIEPLLRSPSLSPATGLPPYLDVAGKRFRFGIIGEQKVVIVLAGLAMLNAGVTTQLLLALFDVKGVVHFGIAGNADPNHQIGDVVVPRYWAHTGLWYWQRYGDGPDKELALESNGDYTRKLGNFNFSDYSVVDKNDSLLNSVWYQPEEVFLANGTPDVRSHVFWVPVDGYYYDLISRKLEGRLELEGCVVVNNGTTTKCLPRPPVVAVVERGCSATVFVDNAAYRGFLRSRFGVTVVEMETTAIALVALQQGTPFIAIRALSDLAGGGSAESNEAGLFEPLAAQNAVTVAVEFISLLC